MVAPQVVTLSVTGMTCQNCVRHVRRALESVAGVVDVAIDLATGRVDVRYEGESRVDALLAAIASAGYEGRSPR
jgi:copper chaperone CopZ